jgi:hypothetical protein
LPKALECEAGPALSNLAINLRRGEFKVGETIADSISDRSVDEQSSCKTTIINFDAMVLKF